MNIASRALTKATQAWKLVQLAATQAALGAVQDALTEAEGDIDVLQAAQTGDAPPSQSPTDSNPYTLPLADRADFGVEVPTHANDVEVVVPSTAPAGSEWHISVEHTGCYMTVSGDAATSITPNMALNTGGDATESVRFVSGGNVIIRVRSNAGSAPVVEVLGDIVMEDTVSGAITVDGNRIGRSILYTGSGSAFTVNDPGTTGIFTIEHDGDTAAITFTNGTSTQKGSASVAVDENATFIYFDGGAQFKVLSA